ncbi:MAG: hypothetical protein LBK95_20000 [Bifidobacteriaceae bacterium]|jgi:hypothetical protein|nr:hypothetical protein [Bifidobacteriaceae bacterium]
MNAPITEAHARRVGVWPNVWYRAFPTRRDYSFTFEHANGGGWIVYINNSPDYRGRASGSVASHRLGIGTRPYICWDSAIETLSQAQGVAALWADSTENYIATGAFRPAEGRPQVKDRSVLNGYASRGMAARPSAALRPGSDQSAGPGAPRSLWSRVRGQLFN